MRLVCPNCDAQYEVDDAAIPEAGRDVQCSSCGHAWFQRHPDIVAEEEQEEEIFLDPEDEVTAPPEQALRDAPRAGPSGAPPIADQAGARADAASATHPAADPGTARHGADPDRSETTPRVAPDTDPTEAELAEAGRSPHDSPAQGATDQPHQRRGLDDNLMAVLREEAEREAAARKSEAPRGLETQTDLGLMPPAAAVPASVLAARERFKDLSVDAAHDDGDEATEADDARPASRRELLPDIEEINSTLRASSEPRGEGAAAVLPPPEPADARRGFRSGFTLMLIVAAALWLAYVMAPRIVTQIPASEAAMQAYVSAVDKARIGVDAALQSASRQLRSLSNDQEQGG